MPSLQGQSAVVFGASSGIGRATAQSLAREGAFVVVAARRESELQELAADIQAAGGKCAVSPADVFDREQVDRAVALAVAQTGRLDIVVNTAGTNIADRDVHRVTKANWQTVMDTNATGAFNTLQAGVQYMREHGGGLIVQISSVSGRWGDLSGAAYQASKHAVMGLCYGAMFEERKNGIRVTAILPGLVETPMPKRRVKPWPEGAFEKAMQPEDIAAACIFLAQLPPRTYVPELIMMPPQLQCLGSTAI